MQVRYAWADYVDCVLVNNDSLPAGPFVYNISTPSDLVSSPSSLVSSPSGRAGSSSALAKADAVGPRARAERIQSPPLGTNTWNFYHCNIDENIVKGLADTFNTNGMAKVHAVNSRVKLQPDGGRFNFARCSPRTPRGAYVYV